MKPNETPLRCYKQQKRWSKEDGEVRKSGKGGDGIRRGMQVTDLPWNRKEAVEE